MLIAVMSDLHDNVAAWGIIDRMLAERKITTLINCGDTCAPAMLEEMSKSFHGDIHTVFGNVVDRDLETEVVKKLGSVTHYGDHADFTLDRRRIGVTHQPSQAQAMVDHGGFDLVCHGHTHLKRWEKIGSTYVLNPGTAGGMFQYPSFAFIRLPALKHEFIDLKL